MKVRSKTPTYVALRVIASVLCILLAVVIEYTKSDWILSLSFLILAILNWRRWESSAFHYITIIFTAGALAATALVIYTK